MRFFLILSRYFPNFTCTHYSVSQTNNSRTVWPQLDHTYFCREQDDTREDQRIIPLIRTEKSDCHTTKSTFTSPIVLEINIQYLIVIPTLEPIKLFRSWETKGMILLKKISRAILSSNCTTTVEKVTFPKSQQIKSNELLISPEIRTSILTVEVKNAPIHPHTVHLDKIKTFKKTSILVQ